MTSHWLVQIAIVAFIVFWMVGAYNRLMRSRNAVAAAWAQGEPARALRSDIMASVMTKVRGALAEEAGTMQALAEADLRTRQAAEAVRASRAQPETVAQWAAMEAALASPSTRLKALLDLHAAQLREDPACATLPADIRAWQDADARIAFARQTYNQAALAYNAAMMQWPTRCVTIVFGFKPVGSA